MFSLRVATNKVLTLGLLYSSKNIAYKIKGQSSHYWINLQVQYFAMLYHCIMPFLNCYSVVCVVNAAGVGSERVQLADDNH